MRLALLAVLVALPALGAYLARETGAGTAPPAPVPAPGPLRLYSDNDKGYVLLPAVVKTDEEWRKQLTPEQFRVTRRAGTERAFTGPHGNEHRHGLYRCVACGTDLFRSEARFDSGTGWPSFFEPVAPDNVETRLDRSLFQVRVEVLCRRCGAHLGHVFSDGPRPTGLRYCMNGTALAFTPRP
jgi:peptide-methionine (R)-S-oxide reductase